jgi:3-oxoacyl-[acyl-carrier-protein] synthase-3
MSNNKIIDAGFVSLSAFLPAKELSEAFTQKLVAFLRKHTIIPNEYVEYIELEKKLPGFIETNESGWKSKPWYQTWFDKLPEKQKADPFRGAVERRRVPMDPESLRSSIHPHPMVPSDAEALVGAMVLCNSNIDPDEIDLVMSHAQVPDYALPQNASLIQHKLKLKNAGAYGVDSCCSSFVTMTEVACTMVRAGVKKNILVIGSYIDSHITDKTTYFSPDVGDAAVAGIVSAVAEGEGYLASHSLSHGSRHNGIIFQRRSPMLLKRMESGPDYAQEFTTFYNPVACKEIAVNAADDLKFVVDKSLEKANLKVEDIDFLTTHQPVAWVGHLWREAIGMPKEKFYESFKKYGNIANCAAINNMFEAIEKGLIKPHDKVILASSGAGENHISVIMKISPVLVEQIRNNAL